MKTALLTCAGIFVAALSLQAQQRPWLHYAFDEYSNNSTPSTGTQNAPLVINRSASGKSNESVPAGQGVSGLTGDYSWHNATTTGMGGNLRRPGEGGLAQANPQPPRDFHSFTVQGWFRTEPDAPLGNYARILEWRQRNEGFALFASDTGQLRISLQDTNVDSAAGYGQTAEWVFFAVTYNSRDNGRPVRFFAGTGSDQVQELDVAGPILTGPIPMPASQPLYLGNSRTGDRPFQGWLDNIRIYQSDRNATGALDLEALENLRRQDTRSATISGSPRFFMDTQESPNVPTDEMANFQAHLYGEMSILFTDLKPDTYQVEIGAIELHSSELDRAFNIAINGTPVVRALHLNEDIGFQVPWKKQFRTRISRGEDLRIDFFAIERKNHPRLSFIKVYNPAGELVRQFQALDEKPDSWIAHSPIGMTPRSLEKPRQTLPPWEGTYRIYSHETDRLTPADLPGPDGLVYPDWRWAGLREEIEVKPLMLNLSDFGAKAGHDVAGAIQKAVDTLAEAGGGVLEVEAGTYYLDYPVLISHNDITIRGAGKSDTVFNFRFGPETGEVLIMSSEPGPIYKSREDGDQLSVSGGLDIYVPWQGLKTLRATVNGSRVADITPHRLELGTSFFFLRGTNLLRHAQNGVINLEVIAEYENPSHNISLQKEIPISTEHQSGPLYTPSYNSIPAAFIAWGEGVSGQQFLLTEDATRGATHLRLAEGHPFKAGDIIQLEAPASDRWNRLVRNARQQGGTYRINQYTIVKAEATILHLNQPLRLDFPIEDNSYVQRFRTVENIGLENMTIVQEKDVWINGITLSGAHNTYIRDMEIRNAGRHAIHVINSKNCEIRNVLLDSARFTGGGGSAYVGFERSFDCLMENVETRKMRHAPNVQWGASGNVIRNSNFIGSDGQWHAGWTNENLYENNIIRSEYGTGGYGFGLYASSVDTHHGPQGPRNVVYNNDISSPRSGIWMGGMNEAWIIAHNRFIIDEGQGVSGKDSSFDHVILNNAFAIRNPRGAPIWFATADCIGWDVRNNTFWGVSGNVTGGAGKATVKGNEMNSRYREPVRPTPEVSSIFEWQRIHKPLDRQAFVEKAKQSR